MRNEKSTIPHWMMLYFAMLGIGFIAVEIVIIQQTRLVLGHPDICPDACTDSFRVMGISDGHWNGNMRLRGGCNNQSRYHGESLGGVAQPAAILLPLLSFLISNLVLRLANNLTKISEITAAVIEIYSTIPMIKRIVYA